MSAEAGGDRIEPSIFLERMGKDQRALSMKGLKEKYSLAPYFSFEEVLFSDEEKLKINGHSAQELKRIGFDLNREEFVIDYALTIDLGREWLVVYGIDYTNLSSMVFIADFGLRPIFKLGSEI